MHQLVTIGIFYILLPVLTGFLYFEWKKRKRRGDIVSVDVYRFWAAGFFGETGIYGLWRHIGDKRGVLPTSRDACIFAITVIAVFVLYYSVKTFLCYRKGNKIKISIGNESLEKDGRVFIIYLLIFLFILTVAEDTVYYTDTIDDVLSKGLGDSLYTYVLSLTSLKQMKLVYYLQPMMFFLLAFRIYQLIINELKIPDHNRNVFWIALAIFYAIPIWRDEWNGYNFFGRLWDTLSFVSCVLAPMVFLWIMRVVSFIQKPRTDKTVDKESIIEMGIVLFLLAGVVMLCQIFRYPLAVTPIANEIDLDLNPIFLSRSILQDYGVNRFNPIIVPLLMIILLYLKDDKGRKMVYIGSGMMILFILVSKIVVNNYGIAAYASLAVFSQLPIYYSYVVYLASKDRRSWKKYAVIICSVLLLIAVCWFNFSAWNDPYRFVQGG